MRSRIAAPSIGILVVLMALSGCFGGSDDATIKSTGRVVELKMWVEDLRQTVFPGYDAAFWAFCVEALPGSEDAVEYQSFSQPCSVPGPTIRVNQGDLVKVEFANPHGFPHTVHWHGQLVENGHDGVPGITQDTIMPGSSFNYEFVAKREGTLMYHCHVDTQHHVVMGLYGPFIVEPQHTKNEPQYDRDYTLMISHTNKEFQQAPEEGSGGGHDHGGGGANAYGTGNPGLQNAPLDLDYDVFMLNGKSFPLTIQDNNTVVKVAEGERVKIRFANMGFVTETMHLHGHDMLVTHKDGKLLNPAAQYWADTLRVDPGERYDVIVDANNPGKWVLHTHYPNHVANDHQYPGGLLTQFLYEGFENQTFELHELPGGGVPAPGPSVPEDYKYAVKDEFTSLDYAISYQVPVEQLVGLEKIRLDLALDGGATPLDEVTLTLQDPQGVEVDTVAVGGMDGEDSAKIEKTNVTRYGTYTAILKGTGVGVEYSLTVLVDYEQPASSGGGGGHH